MPTVDTNALLIAEKALTIGHIVGICIFNLFVLYRVYNEIKGTGVKPRLLLIVSLCCGDLFLALFSLNLRAINLFGDTTSVNCPAFLMTAYAFQVLPFAYTMGLCTMCFEIVFRSRFAKGQANILTSLLFSAIPWILALIIALPIAVAGVQWDTCTAVWTLGRLRSQWIVCLILPSFVAVVVSITLKCTRLQHNGNLSNRVPVEGEMTGMQTSYQPHLSQQQHMGQQAFTGQQPFTGQLTGQQPYTGQQQFPAQQPYIGQQPHTGQQHFPVQQLNIAQQPYTGQQPNLDLAPVSVEREKATLLNVSLIFLFLSFPWAIFYLAHFLNLNPLIIDPFALTIIVKILEWVFYFRCFITAACWLMALRPLRELIPK